MIIINSGLLAYMVCMGIEYDGERWHSDELKLESDNEKGARIIASGIKLIRVREPNCPKVIDGSTIITTPKPSADWLYLETAVEDLIKTINQLFNASIAIDIDIQKDLATALELFQKVSVSNSIASIRPDLVKEWDYEKNKPLKPENIPAHSGLNAWWVCSSCGSKWSAMVASRVSGKGCPNCGRIRSAKAKNKKIRIVETGQEFDSVKDAAIFLGNEKYIHNIANCAKGRRKTAYGYHWEYVDI